MTRAGGSFFAIGPLSRIDNAMPVPVCTRTFISDQIGPGGVMPPFIELKMNEGSIHFILILL